MLLSDFIPEDKNEISIYFQGQLIKVHLVELESLGHPSISLAFISWLLHVLNHH